MIGLIILMTFLIQVEAGRMRWGTDNAPRLRRDAEADRHRVSGTCKFPDFFRTGYPFQLHLNFYILF